MFLHLTDRVNRALDLAREEAFSLNHGYVGPEHLVLGIIRLELEEQGSSRIDLEIARNEVAAKAGIHSETTAQPDLFPNVLRLLELARQEAQHQHEDTQTDIGHVWVAIFRVDEERITELVANKYDKDIVRSAEGNAARDLLIRLAERTGLDLTQFGADTPNGLPGSSSLPEVNPLDELINGVYAQLGNRENPKDTKQAIADANVAIGKTRDYLKTFPSLRPANTPTQAAEPVAVAAQASGRDDDMHWGPL
jgi:hypothetical protein